MQKPDTNLFCETEETHTAGFRSRKTLSMLHRIASRAPARNFRLAMPLRRRETCLTKRAMLAALREAEFAEWMNSGGDFLDSMHQPVS